MNSTENKNEEKQETKENNGQTPQEQVSLCDNIAILVTVQTDNRK